MIRSGRIKTRTDLIETACRLAPTRACKRAIQEDRVQVVGGFANIPPFDLPGWVCCIRSKHGRVWLLAVLIDEITHTYKGGRLDEIPWKNYAPGPNDAEANPYRGDNPKLAAECCAKALVSDVDCGSDMCIADGYFHGVRGNATSGSRGSEGPDRRSCARPSA